MSLSLVPILGVDDPHLEWVLDRLEAQFPPCERESREEVVAQVQSRTGHSNWIFELNGIKIGFARAMVLPGTNEGWIIHLALEAEFRGSGWGLAAFEAVRGALKAQSPDLRGIFLEVERIEDATNEAERQARRKRLAFFERLGAQALTSDYIQPPSQPGQPEVPLNLLYWGEPPSDVNTAIKRFYRSAFGSSPPKQA